MISKKEEATLEGLIPYYNDILIAFFLGFNMQESNSKRLIQIGVLLQGIGRELQHMEVKK